MVEQIRGLIIKDSSEDATRIVHELEEGGYAVEAERVESTSELDAALTRQTWDIVLSDYALSSLTALDVLPLIKARDPELPLIIVTHTATEETIVAAIRAGATDFFTHSDLSRLVPAVEREIRDSQHRRQRAIAEEQLRQSQRLFATAFHANPTGIVLTRVSDGRILDANNQFLKITGYSHDELIGKNGPEINLWVSDTQRRELAQRLRQGEDLENVEIGFRYGSGELGVALLSTARIELDGEPCIFSMVYDITEQKQMTDRLRLLYEIGKGLASLVVDEPGQLYLLIYEHVVRRLFDAPHLVIAHYEPETELITCEFAIVDGEIVDPSIFPRRELGVGPISDAIRTRRIVINNPSELIRKPQVADRHVLIGDERMPQSGLYMPLITGDKIYGIITIQHYEPHVFDEKDVELLETIGSQIATALENAHLYKVVRSHVETLEQRVSERTAELEKAKEWTESILTSTSDVIILADERGHLIQANPAFREQFLIHPETMVGKPLAEVIHRSSVNALTGAIQRALETKTTVQTEVVGIRRDDTLFEAELAITPLAQDSPTPNVVCALHDVTRHKQMEAGLRSALEQEKQLNELKQRFSSMVSHEFRTPLTVILAAVELLKAFGKRLSEERRQEKLAEVEKQVHRLVRLLDDVLQISRAESIQVETTRKPIRLDELCRQLVDEIQQTTARHTIRLLLVDADRPVQLEPVLMSEVLRNLLSNAVKYSPSGGDVEVRCRIDAEQIVLEVSDQGIGIPQEDVPRLFDAFHRAHNVEAITGTGLGLAIVERGVRAHQGSITIESQEAVGTTFIVRIPLVDAA